ncbi:MAG: FkbM family methyltransferase [Chlamydiia bacterium]|nr:FkbM family methyltransferase [Chlamydiia bacterium]
MTQPFRFFSAKYFPKPQKLIAGAYHLKSDCEIVKLAFIRSVLNKDDIAIDVGAYIGFYTQLMSQYVGNKGRVLAYEPNPYIFRVLRRLIKKQSNISAWQRAVSEQSNHRLAMKLHPYSLKTNSTVELKLMGKERMRGWSKNVDVQTEALNDLCRTLSSPIAFIKIDAQGHEYEVLKGADKLIEKDLPPLLCKYTFEAGVFEPQTPSLLKEYGYECYDIGMLKSFEKAPNSPYETNLIAIPKERRPEYQEKLSMLTRLFSPHCLASIHHFL